MKPTLEMRLAQAEDDMAANLRRVETLRWHANSRRRELAAAELDLSANLAQIAELRLEMIDRDQVMPEPPVGAKISFDVQFDEDDKPYTFLAYRFDIEPRFADGKERWLITKYHGDRMTWEEVVHLMKQNVGGIRTPAYAELVEKNVPF